MCVLQADVPYIVFHADKVTLRADVSLLPKVVLQFYGSQDIVLPFPLKKPQQMCSKHYTLHMLKGLWLFILLEPYLTVEIHIFLSAMGMGRKSLKISSQLDGLSHT